MGKGKLLRQDNDLFLTFIETTNFIMKDFSLDYISARQNDFTQLRSCPALSTKVVRF